MNHGKTLLAASLLLGLNTVTAQAALQSRAGGTMLYDTIKNITWVADANLFKTQADASDDANAFVQSIITNIGSITDSVGSYTLQEGIDFNTPSGAMSWYGAQAWVANLNYGGYADWRLPTVTDLGFPGCNNVFTGASKDCGYSVDTSSSELAHMYHNNLGLKSFYDKNGIYQPDFGIFGNGTSYEQNNLGPVTNLQSGYYWSGTEEAPSHEFAWLFFTITGEQDSFYKDFGGGHAWAVRDGDVATVPVPGAVWLFGSGLLGLLGVFRHRRNAV